MISFLVFMERGRGKGREAKERVPEEDGRGESNFGFPKNVARHASGYLVSVLYKQFHL